MKDSVPHLTQPAAEQSVLEIGNTPCHPDKMTGDDAAEATADARSRR